MKNIEPRYLIWGYYGFGNLGDDLMLRVIAAKIRERHPRAVIFARCFDAPAGVDVVPVPIDRNAMANRLLNAVRYGVRLARVIAAVDVFVLGGGTFFLDKGRHSFSLFFLTLAVLIARTLRRKVILVGIGIDALTHPTSLRYLRYVLRKSDFAALRDEYSYTVARQISPRGSVVRSSDIVFDAAFAASLTCGSAVAGEHIVVTLSDYFASHPVPGARSAFLEQSVETVRILLERFAGETPVILCAFQRSLGERDYEFMKEVRDRVLRLRLDRAERLVLVSVASDAEVRDIFGRARFVLGMRYHGLVLSALFRKPFLGIDIEMKIKEICREFGMPHVSIHDFLHRGLAATEIDNLLGRTVTPNLLAAHAALSSRNFDWLSPRTVAGEQP